MNIPNKIIPGSGNDQQFVRQHLIDPESCLCCGSCEAACTEGAIQTDRLMQRYVIDPAKCNNSHACLDACSSNAIKTWHMVPAGKPYSIEEQFAWDVLPPQLEIGGQTVPLVLDEDELPQGHPAPASASEPVTFRYTQQKPLAVRIESNVRVTDSASDTDIHHIVLDFQNTDFTWLEGQNIGVLPQGTDAKGHAHHMRAYSIASSRDGETTGSRQMALTIKRVIDVQDGKPYYGIASNYMCDLKPGDTVRCIGPIGSHFLMPQDPASRIMMICSGTGIAPMRSFIQQKMRIDDNPRAPLQLFYGGRTETEMAYVDELRQIPQTTLALHLALSRSPVHPKRYVQDLLRERSDQVAECLQDRNGHIFICGMIAMGQAVMSLLAEIAEQHQLPWEDLHRRLLHEGRLQIETY